MTCESTTWRSRTIADVKTGFEGADFEALADLWRRCHEPKYHIDAATLKRHTVDVPVFDWGASCIALKDGRPCCFVAVKRSAGPRLYRGPDPDQAHLCALVYEDPQTAIDLMAYTKGVLRNRGIYRLIFGQDSRHLFPGCPTDCPTLRDFLIIEGFQEGTEVHDLERNLADYSPPPDASPREEPDGGGVGTQAKLAVEVRPVTDAELPLLRIFLNREFAGRWAYDVLQKIEVEGRSDFVLGLFAGAACEGFAVTQDGSHRMPIAGAVWKESIGEGWSALGPVGVSRSMRGQGWGRALVAESLERLKASGARRCLVDWTAVPDFYKSLGFEISRTYRSFELRLDL